MRAAHFGQVLAKAAERGRGDNDPGAHEGAYGLQGIPSWGRWIQGAQQRAHRNDTEKSTCEARRSFFFGDHLNSTEKLVRISVKTFFFGDHIIFRTKMRHFLRLFWISKNRKSIIFELALGPTFGHRRPWPWPKVNHAFVAHQQCASIDVLGRFGV